MDRKKQRGTQSLDIEECGVGADGIWRQQFAGKMSDLDPLADAGYTEAARERIGIYAKYLRRGYPMPTEQFLRMCD